MFQYEQLINNEFRKEEHLRSIIKIRERALIDRTKGQIAWLELQKQKYKQLGKTAEIASTKKKQRALIVRLEKERAAMNKYISIFSKFKKKIHFFKF